MPSSARRWSVDHVSRAIRAAVEPLESRLLLSSYTVTNLNDSGPGSLRDAVQQANANPGADTISFMAALTGSVTLTSGSLVVSDKTGPTTITETHQIRTFTGQSAPVIVVDAGASAALSGIDMYEFANGGPGILNNGTMNISSCDLLLGPVTGNGGAIDNTGSMTIDQSYFSASAPSGKGGAIYNDHGTLSVDYSQFDQSSAVSGGAIYNDQGTAIIKNSSFYMDSANSGNGGAIASTGTLELVQTTMTRNYASALGSAVYAAGTFSATNSTIDNNNVALDSAATATLYNTIVGGNGATDIVGMLDQHLAPGQASSSHDLIGGAGSGGLVNGVNGNIVEVDPRLGGGAGGTTLSLVPLPGSPAIDAGSNALAVDPTTNPPTPLTTDQRGMPRIVNGNVDIGAAESAPLVVNTIGANVDGIGQLSLQDAIGLADQFTGPSTITFDPAVFAPGSMHTIANFPGNIIRATAGPVTIVGPGVNVLTISSTQDIALNVYGTAIISGVTLLGGLDAVYSSGNLTVNDCVLSGGSANIGNGAIFNTGTLLVSNSTFSNNHLGMGGGLYNSGTATVSVCTFVGNSVSKVGEGGAIYNTGALDVTGSTFSGNSASRLGGAIYNYTSSATPASLMVTSCTFVGNSASLGGAILNDGAKTTATITNSTISGNSSGNAINGATGVTLRNTIVASNLSSNGTAADVLGNLGPASSNNLIGTGGSGGLMNGVNGNIVGVTDPRLGPLADNGGPTQTMALLPGSPAIDAGSNALAVNPDGTPLTTDQRGLPRISNGFVDIGAYELQQTRLAVPSVVGGAGATISLTATLSADGAPLAGELIQFMLLGKAVGSASTDASGVATLKGVSLAGVSPGQYPRAIGAAFAGDAAYAASSGTGDLFAAVSDPAPVNVTLGDGTAQRSEVRSITLKFYQPVTLQAGALTLALLNTGGSGSNDGSPPTDATAALAAPTTPDGGVTWVFKLMPNTRFVDPTGSLLDGIYTATINQAKVIVAGGNSLSGASTGFTFHRLFGDINGDGAVNSADYFQFKKAFGSRAGSPLYNPNFDFDANGTVNSADYFKFKSNFGKKFIGG